MNRGVEILLVRMDSHPEEFDEYGPWAWVINNVLDERHARAGGNVNLTYSRVRFLSDEELNALADKLSSLQGDAFTRKVMDQLLNLPDRDVDITNTMIGGFGQIVSGQIGVPPSTLSGLSGVQYPRKLTK